MKSANPDHWDFYKKFRRRMMHFCDSPKGKAYRFREILLIGPDLLHLSIKLVLDDDVPVRHKIKLSAAIAYFISPFDLLPEVILGPFGYLDDIAITAYVLNSLLNDVPQAVLDRYWAGDGDVLMVIRAVALTADRMFGKGLIQRVLGRFDSKHIPSSGS